MNGPGDMLPAFGSVEGPRGARLPKICTTRTPESASHLLTAFSSVGSSYSCPLNILICCMVISRAVHGPVIHFDSPAGGADREILRPQRARPWGSGVPDDG